MRTPEFCLICSSGWTSGASRPDEYLEPGQRVFYACGASLVYDAASPGMYLILIKNCINGGVKTPMEKYGHDQN